MKTDLKVHQIVYFALDRGNRKIGITGEVDMIFDENGVETARIINANMDYSGHHPKECTNHIPVNELYTCKDKFKDETGLTWVRPLHITDAEIKNTKEWAITSRNDIDATFTVLPKDILTAFFENPDAITYEFDRITSHIENGVTRQTRNFVARQISAVRECHTVSGDETDIIAMAKEIRSDNSFVRYIADTRIPQFSDGLRDDIAGIDELKRSLNGLVNAVKKYQEEFSMATIHFGKGPFDTYKKIKKIVDTCTNDDIYRTFITSADVIIYDASIINDIIAGLCKLDIDFTITV